MADQCPLIPVNDIFFGKGILAHKHQVMLHHVLDILHQIPIPLFALYVMYDLLDLFFGYTEIRVYGFVCLTDRPLDLVAVKFHGRAVSFNDFHRKTSFAFLSSLLWIRHNDTTYFVLCQVTKHKILCFFLFFVEKCK